MSTQHQSAIDTWDGEAASALPLPRPLEERLVQMAKCNAYQAKFGGQAGSIDPEVVAIFDEIMACKSADALEVLTEEHDVSLSDEYYGESGLKDLKTDLQNHVDWDLVMLRSAVQLSMTMGQGRELTDTASVPTRRRAP